MTTCVAVSPSLLNFVLIHASKPFFFFFLVQIKKATSTVKQLPRSFSAVLYFTNVYFKQNKPPNFFRQ